MLASINLLYRWQPSAGGIIYLSWLSVHLSLHANYVLKQRHNHCHLHQSTFIAFYCKTFLIEWELVDIEIIICNIA